MHKSLLVTGKFLKHFEKLLPEWMEQSPIGFQYWICREMEFAIKRICKIQTVFKLVRNPG